MDRIWLTVPSIAAARWATAWTLTFSLLLSGFSATAQERPTGIVTSVTGVNAEPELYYDVSLSTYDRIMASVKFAQKSQKPKVILTAATLASSRRTLVNTLLLNFAQSDSISTFGVGFTFSNYLGYNHRADRIWQAISRDVKPFRNQRGYPSFYGQDCAEPTICAVALEAWAMDESWSTLDYQPYAGSKVDDTLDQRIMALEIWRASLLPLPRPIPTPSPSRLQSFDGLSQTERIEAIEQLDSHRW